MLIKSFELSETEHLIDQEIKVNKWENVYFCFYVFILL